jgi:hypothetical protein
MTDTSRPQLIASQAYTNCAADRSVFFFALLSLRAAHFGGIWSMFFDERLPRMATADGVHGNAKGRGLVCGVLLKPTTDGMR